jgi:dienelactone hydrolase
LLVILFATACTRLGKLDDGARGVLEEDGVAGGYPVLAFGTHVGDWDDGFPVVLYRPKGIAGPLPTIVFLPARSAPEQQYESWGRMLASRCFLVAVRGWYGFFRTDPQLAHDARFLTRWLVDRKYADGSRIGLAGHSMGGKSAIMAAIDDPHIRAVVAIDPDENGYTHVARGPIERLRPPLLVLGMELAYKAFRLCATPDGNYRSFFPHAPAGTVELTLLGADHVQVMDRPDSIGMGICRVGTADSRSVRTIARDATMRFFQRHLMAIPIELPDGPGIEKRIKTADATTRRN